MYKHYPYLQDSYIFQTDIEREKRSILKDIDSFLNQRQYIKITLLDWDEEPIKAIEGEISSGSISKNGDSPIRRTAQLTCAVDARSYSVDDGRADFAINKKVFIEIGVKNETPHYPDYPIYWFPEGVFFIGSFSINAGSNSSTVITLSLKDKMAMLNGDVGGILPATTIFDSMDTQLPNGEYIEKKVLIYNIIQEAVHHYGGEDLNRIVIEGVPLRIRRIMQWTGDVPLYQITTAENANDAVEVSNELTGNFYTFTTEEPESGVQYIKFEKGDDVGYIMDDFVVIDDLTGAPGESVVSILDKIKNLIGNYEYFYDVFGVFHFREIKNYYVTTQARTLLDEMAENDYLLEVNEITEQDYMVEVNDSKSVYTFDDEKLLTSITVAPQYENIKNDYIIEGQTTVGDSNIIYPVRYHLAIDDKPNILGTDNRSFVRQKIDNQSLIDEKLIELNKLSTSQENSSKILEELLYKIRLLKTNIESLESIISVKDKELLKYLQEYKETNYSYEELTQKGKLLSEVWLTKINAVENNLKDYIENLQDTEVQDYERKLDEYMTTIDSLNNSTQLTQNLITQYKQDAEDIDDLIAKIYKVDKNNFPMNEALYQNSKKALKYQNAELDNAQTQYDYYDSLFSSATSRFESFKNNLKRIYEFIEDSQLQIKDKENKLFGDGSTNIIKTWKANNYDTVVKRVNNSNNIIFSHNILYYDMEKNTDNIYNIDTGDGFHLDKKLLTENDRNIYENSYLHEFLKIWLDYYNKDTNLDLAKIEALQEEIDRLTEENGQFENGIVNKNKGRKYYEIYPTDEIYSAGATQEMILYKHPRNGLLSAAYVDFVQTLPNVGNFNLIYKEMTTNKYYYWDGQTYQEVNIIESYDNANEENLYYAYDWRTKLYLDGLKGVINGTDQGYYFAELSAFWPQVYDLKEQKFFGEKEDEHLYFKTLASTGTYYLDFLDSLSTSFGEWSVKNIGRRSDVIVKEEINCLFQPEIPNVIILPTNITDLSLVGQSALDKVYRYGSSLESQMTLEQLRDEARRNFYPWTQVDSYIFSKLLTGGYKNGAFDQIKYELYLHTRYQKSVSLTSIPVFYLEPNSRITINDTTTNTFGDFVVQSINLTLGPGANMSITCNETAERF